MTTKAGAVASKYPNAKVPIRTNFLRMYSLEWQHLVAVEKANLTFGTPSSKLSLSAPTHPTAHLVMNYLDVVRNVLHAHRYD